MLLTTLEGPHRTNALRSPLVRDHRVDHHMDSITQEVNHLNDSIRHLVKDMAELGDTAKHYEFAELGKVLKQASTQLATFSKKFDKVAAATSKSFAKHVKSARAKVR